MRPTGPRSDSRPSRGPVRRGPGNRGPGRRGARNGGSRNSAHSRAGDAAIPGLAVPAPRSGPAAEKAADRRSAPRVARVARGDAAIPGLEVAADLTSGHHGAAYRRHHPSPARKPVSETRVQQAFISEVAPGAIAAQHRYGVPAAVTIAQAIDESGWGQSQLAAQDHNLFGIKGTGPAGSVPMPTQEYVNGQPVSTSASFRVYHNAAESIDDHGRLLARQRLLPAGHGGAAAPGRVRGRADRGLRHRPQLRGEPHQPHAPLRPVPLQHTRTRAGRTTGRPWRRRAARPFPGCPAPPRHRPRPAGPRVRPPRPRSRRGRPAPPPTGTASPQPTRTASPQPTRTASPEPTRTASPEPTRTASPEPTRTASPAAHADGQPGAHSDPQSRSRPGRPAPSRRRRRAPAIRSREPSATRAEPAGVDRAAGGQPAPSGREWQPPGQEPPRHPRPPAPSPTASRPPVAPPPASVPSGHPGRDHAVRIRPPHDFRGQLRAGGSLRAREPLRLGPAPGPLRAGPGRARSGGRRAAKARSGAAGSRHPGQHAALPAAHAPVGAQLLRADGQGAAAQRGDPLPRRGQLPRDQLATAGRLRLDAV